MRISTSTGKIALLLLFIYVQTGLCHFAFDFSLLLKTCCAEMVFGAMGMERIWYVPV